MPRTGLDTAHLGLRGQRLDIEEHLLWGRCGLEDPRIAADPHNRRENELTESHLSGPGAESLQLPPTDRMVGRLFDHGVRAAR